MVEMPRQEALQPPVSAAQSREDAPPRRRRLTVKRAALTLVLLAGTAVAGHFGYEYWTVGRFQEATDDAYVKADITQVAPKVSGIIERVLVRDNQRVRKGQVLARIDPRDFETALAQARAGVGAAEAAVRNLDAQIALQLAVIEQAEASVVAGNAALTFASQDAHRYHVLVGTGAGTVQRAQATAAARTQAAANLRRDRAALQAARDKIGVLASGRDEAKAQLAHSRAVLRQAELNLSYTTITAPVAGMVGARNLRVGQFVAAGTQLMAVVPLDAVYVVANFKETQLTNVHPGQRVNLAVDLLPGVTLTGHVDSLAPASGLEFALLPPDNATGNFTKIVQRIPVRITLDPSALNARLRAGMSVEPTIDTRGAPPLPAHRG